MKGWVYIIIALRYMPTYVQIEGYEIHWLFQSRSDRLPWFDKLFGMVDLEHVHKDWTPRGNSIFEGYVNLVNIFISGMWYFRCSHGNEKILENKKKTKERKRGNAKHPRWAATKSRAIILSLSSVVPCYLACLFVLNLSHYRW